MKKQQLLLIVVVSAALVLSACGGGGAAPAPSGGAQPAPSTNNAKPTQAPQPQANQQAPAPSQPQATSASGSTQLDLQDVTAGLEGLSSYKSTFSMSFEGTENGQPKSSSFESVEEYVKNPPAKRTTVTGLGSLSSGSTPAPEEHNAMQMIQVNGKDYVVMGTTCVQQTSTNAVEASNTFKPSNIIGDIRGAQYVGDETVNSVPTKHYKTDVSSFAALGYGSAQGDVWVAQTGDFVVKYTFQATGKDKLLGNANSEGTIKWTYELNSVNQPIDIQPPANCGGAAEDIPMMADAENQSSMGGMSTYNSPSKLADVVAFYDKEMPAKGWTAKEGGTSAEGFAQKTYTKDNRTVTIMITADQSSGNTTVLITEEQK